MKLRGLYFSDTIKFWDGEFAVCAEIIGNTTNRSEFARIFFKKTDKVYRIFIRGTESNHEEHEINFSKRISLDKAKDRVREEFQKVCIGKLVRILDTSEENLIAMFRIQKLNEK